MGTAKNFIKISWCGLTTPLFLKYCKKFGNILFFSRFGFKKKKASKIFDELLINSHKHIYFEWKTMPKNILIKNFCHFYEKNESKKVQKKRKFFLKKRNKVGRNIKNFQQNPLLIKLINYLTEINSLSTEKKKLYRASTTFFPLISKNFFRCPKKTKGKSLFQKILTIFFKKIAFLGPRFLNTNICFFKKWRQNMVIEKRRNSHGIFLTKFFGTLSKKIRYTRL